MRKVVVFDDGRGGEIIADYIYDELPIEVIKVIDRQNGSYAEKSGGEIRLLTEKQLKDHIGKVDVIILANSEISLAAKDYLSRNYPEQKFIGYGDNLEELITILKEAMIIIPKNASRMDKYQLTKVQFDGDILEERTEIRQTGGSFSGVVIIYDTNYIGKTSLIKETIGKKVKIIDFRRSLLRELCLALGLRGVDGHSPRDKFGLKNFAGLKNAPGS
ncbi:hypothetical protein IJH74_00560 [Candidatus Saccharibacteria bacterium]|nr:hypothetical protein [Candidatus Saccharibacteria bacterium]